MPMMSSLSRLLQQVKKVRFSTACGIMIVEKNLSTKCSVTISYSFTLIKCKHFFSTHVVSGNPEDGHSQERAATSRKGCHLNIKKSSVPSSQKSELFH